MKSEIKKSSKMTVPDKPPMEAPTRKETPILGQLTEQVKKLDKKKEENDSASDTQARGKLRFQEATGVSSIISEMQSRAVPDVDAAFVDKRIQYLEYFDIFNDEGDVIDKELR